MAPKIAIVFYSMYGHIQKLAEAEKAGIEKAGGTADILQIPETLPEEVLGKMHAPPKPTSIKTLSDPADLEKYDGFLFGIPTRYGNFPAQWKVFWDQTGKQWQSGSYYGKYAGLFVSTASLGGGQETTCLNAMSTLTHHGLIYVPLGYAKCFNELGDVSEVRGGTPWGAGTFASATGARQPTERELHVATVQGEQFYKTVAKATDGGKVPQDINTSTRIITKEGTRATGQDPPSEGQQASSAVEQQNPSSKTGPCGLPAKCVIQ